MEEYLIHHGVKGQRWGIRRYQREDGTRTTLGKKHEAKLAPYNASKNLENKAHTGTTLGKKQEAKLAPYNMLENGQYYVRTLLGKKQEAKLAPYNMLENGQYYVRTAKTR